MKTLHKLVGPELARSFLDTWLDRHCVFHGSPARIPDFTSVPELASVESLLKKVARTRSEASVRVWFQEASGAQAQAAVTADAALALYRTGQVTVVVDQVDRLLPRIGRALKSVVKDLGTPQLGIPSCAVYASPRSKGTNFHFDEQEVFFIQLSGKKRWLIAPNEHVKYPHASYFGGPPSDELKSICRTTPRPPRRAEQIVLKPGSVLYLPRGHWHRSLAASESLALTLTIPCATWLDLAGQLIQDRSITAPTWRRPASGYFSAGKRGAAAQQAMQAQLGELVDDLQTLLA